MVPKYLLYSSYQRSRRLSGLVQRSETKSTSSQCLETTAVWQRCHHGEALFEKTAYIGILNGHFLSLMIRENDNFDVLWFECQPVEILRRVLILDIFSHEVSEMYNPPFHFFVELEV